MRRLLFITSNRLGDAVISTGLLAALLKQSPGLRATVVCGPVAVSLFDACPGVERVIAFRKRRFDLHWLFLWLACMRFQWDGIIDLRGSLIAWCLWARKRRVLRGGRRPGARVSQIGALLGKEETPLPHVWSTPHARAQAQIALPFGKKWLAIAPTANWDGKIWPAHSFVALSRRLQNEGYHVAVFYGPGEREKRLASAVISHLDSVEDMGGDQPLGSVVALLQRCVAFVGNDSGLMHLAAAAGTPTLGLFGPSRASEYGPAGRLARSVVAPGAEGLGKMSELTVEQVHAALVCLLSPPMSQN